MRGTVMEGDTTRARGGSTGTSNGDPREGNQQGKSLFRDRIVVKSQKRTGLAPEQVGTGAASSLKDTGHKPHAKLGCRIRVGNPRRRILHRMMWGDLIRGLVP